MNDLYTFKASLAELKDWHLRLGHLNVQSIMRLFRAGRIHGLDAITSQDLREFECQACIMGKGTRLASPPAPEDTKATALLDLIYVDLWGPATTASIGGKRYFLTVYDDFSHHIDLYFLKNKSDALASLKEFTAKAETQTGRKIKQICSDGGGEFTGNAAKAFYSDKGIQHLLVPPGERVSIWSELS